VYRASSSTTIHPYKQMLACTLARLQGIPTQPQQQRTAAQKEGVLGDERLLLERMKTMEGEGVGP